MGAEVFYRRLMSVVDDFGRTDARSSVLRAALFPLKLSEITDKDITKWLNECSKYELLKCYSIKGKVFLEIDNFGQRLRAMRSKYPAPDDTCGHLSDDNSTLLTDDSKQPPEEESESEVEEESESETNPILKKVVFEKSKTHILFWKELVDVWFTHYEKLKRTKPTFAGVEAKSLKSFLEKLQKKAVEEGYEWTEETATGTFTAILQSIRDKWLLENFMLKNLNSQFDKIYATAKKSSPGEMAKNHDDWINKHFGTK